MERKYYLQRIALQLKVHPICALLGPRQVGKTTLAKMYAEEQDLPVRFFDLENPLDLAQLENPMLTLSRLTGHLIVIDEIQKRPDLFPVLRVLVDNKELQQKYLILGSASRDLIRQSSESLAGRIGYIELPPFSLKEVEDVERLWVRGGFPLSYLAENEEESCLWRQAYISTFLERDIPSLGFQVSPQNMRRFWLMLVHYHGQMLNLSDLGRSLGVSNHTVRYYLDILSGTFMIRVLQPWFENISKRQVKTPKIYFRDSGILHALMGVQNSEQLYTNNKLGASWEGFALEEVIRCTHAEAEECYFWGTQGGAELDLLLIRQGKRIGYECKYTEAPKITASMRIAIEDLSLDHIYVVAPVQQSFPLDEKITVVRLQQQYL